MSRPQVRIINRNYDGAVLLRHRRNRVRVVGVRQMLLCVQIGGENEGFAIVSRSTEAASCVPDRKLRHGKTIENQKIINTAYGGGSNVPGVSLVNRVLN